MAVWPLRGYTYLRDLVRDESGHVVLARHDDSGDTVAIRFLPIDTDADSGGRQAAVAARLAGLEDPHLGVPRDCVQSEQGVAIVRDLVGGVALRALLVEEGAVGPEAALVVLADVLRGLAAAHERDVAHRDCRPGTVLVTRTGGAVLVDVGIARPADRELTAVGRPFYLAPEQWNGAEPGSQGDIYAATATFFECVAGAPPYFGTDLARLHHRHETAAPPVDALPGPLRALTARGLAKHPQDRPATATAFLAEVEAAAGHGYGPAWDSQGRAALTRLATGARPAFPRDAATVPGEVGSPAPVAAPRRPVAGRLGRTVSAAAVAAALAIGLVNVLPSGTTADERDGSAGSVRAVPPAVDPALPTPGPESLPAERASAEPAPAEQVPGNAAAAPPAAPGTGEPEAAPPADTTGAAPTSRATETGSDTPTPSAAPPSAPARVDALSIDSFEKQGGVTRLVMHVGTSSSAPVELLIGYRSGRQVDPGSARIHTTTRQLSSHTSYVVVDEQELGTECLDYWTVVVAESAAGDMLDTAELIGEPCDSDGQSAGG